MANASTGTSKVTKTTPKTTGRDEKKNISFGLVLVCWILPLIALAFGHGDHWWQMLLWLFVGTIVLVAKVERMEKDEAAAKKK